jgi:hypothetical protein
VYLSIAVTSVTAPVIGLPGHNTVPAEALPQGNFKKSSPEAQTYDRATVADFERPMTGVVKQLLPGCYQKQASA